MNQQVRGQGRKKFLDRTRKRKETQNKQVVKELQDNMKHNNIHIIGMPKGEEEEQGI